MFFDTVENTILFIKKYDFFLLNTKKYAELVFNILFTIFFSEHINWSIFYLLYVCYYTSNCSQTTLDLFQGKCLILSALCKVHHCQQECLLKYHRILFS